MDFSAAGSVGSAERSAFEHDLKIDLSNASAAMPAGALQCGAVCCSVLQCIHTHHQLVQSNASAASYAAKKTKSRELLFWLFELAKSRKVCRGLDIYTYII
jgi:hypothetical protein